MQQSLKFSQELATNIKSKGSVDHLEEKGLMLEA